MSKEKTSILPRRTTSEALADWGKILALSALLGGSAMALPRLLSGAAKTRNEPTPQDIDVDVLDPRMLARLIALQDQQAHPEQKLLEAPKEAMTKAAEPPKDPAAGKMPHWQYYPGMVLSGLGGALLGMVGTKRLADIATNWRTRRDLEAARKRFRAAMLAEQLAALESGSRGPFSPFIESGSMGKSADSKVWDTMKEVADIVATGPAIWTSASALLSYLVLRDYFKHKDPKWVTYRKAQKALSQRMAAEPPYAQLTSSMPALAEKAAQTKAD